jgi:hypothetical protein
MLKLSSTRNKNLPSPNPDKLEISAVLKATAVNSKWFDWLTAMSSVEWLTILSEVGDNI